MFFNLKATNTSPISTGIIEPLVAGANLAQSSSFSTKMTELLYMTPAIKDLARYFMTKSNSGVVSLHCMVPYQRISTRMSDNNRPTFQRPVVFVGVNCNKNEYDTKESNIHVISENALAMSELSFNSEGTYNGVAVIGSPILNYIPYSLEVWGAPMGDSTVGQKANELVLSSFFKMRDLVAEMSHEDFKGDAQAILDDIKKEWLKYELNEKTLVKKEYLVESNLIYADSCALVPLTTCFAITTSSTNRFLDSRRIYGSVEAGASFAPMLSLMSLTGVITPTEAEPISGYKYGQYAVNSKRDEVVVVPADKKADTLETCTREILVYDSSGRNTPIQATLNDLTRNGKPVKRSSLLADLPSGSVIKAHAKLNIRNRKASCLAVTFRASIYEWTTEGRTASAEINSNLATEELSFDETSFDELLSIPVKTDEIVKTEEVFVEVETDTAKSDDYESF